MGVLHAKVISSSHRATNDCNCCTLFRRPGSFRTTASRTSHPQPSQPHSLSLRASVTWTPSPNCKPPNRTARPTPRPAVAQSSCAQAQQCAQAGQQGAWHGATPTRRYAPGSLTTNAPRRTSRGLSCFLPSVGELLLPHKGETLTPLHAQALVTSLCASPPAHFTRPRCRRCCCCLHRPPARPGRWGSAAAAAAPPSPAAAPR